MPRLPFKQVDVFMNVRFKGNPLAVILKGDELSTEEMQQIANWTNLSETTFVLTPTEPSADYHVRIFTPTAELPFAGHPTIGTCHALLEAGVIRPRDGALVQQCGAGAVPLTITRTASDEQWIAFDLPTPKLNELGEQEIGELESVLGTSLRHAPVPRIVDVGPRWLIVQVDGADTVLGLQPDFQRMKMLDQARGLTGTVVFGEQSSSAPSRIEVRAFAPAHGINEDPVCGSGNGAVAAFIRATGQIEHFGRDYLASQGAVVGRAGILRLTLEESRIQVGGNAITCVDGYLDV